MRELDHPSILKLEEVYETQENVYLVMELIKGGELIKRIKDRGNYTISEMNIVIKNILKALVFIHSKNIIHR